MGERRTHNAQVAGSNPAPATICPHCGAPIDPETCWCGAPIDDGHERLIDGGHGGVGATPLGCMCHKLEFDL